MILGVRCDGVVDGLDSVCYNILVRVAWRRVRVDGQDKALFHHCRRWAKDESEISGRA